MLSRRYPFTLTTLFLLALTAWFTASHTGPLAGKWLNGLGFAPRDLPDLQWARLITSAFVTHGGWTFWRAMAMVALFVGAAEHLVRSRVAAMTFWGSHLAVLVLIALILRPPGLTPPSFVEGLLPLPRDVGPSVGCFACLGLAVACLRVSVTRSLSTAGILVALIATMFLPSLAEVSWEVDLLADAGHLAGFIAGWIVGYRYARPDPV